MSNDLPEKYSRELIKLAYSNDVLGFGIVNRLESIPLKSERYIDMLRDLAIEIENYNPIASFLLMSKAYELRPGGKFIAQKLVAYASKLGVGDGVIDKRANLHNIHKKKILEIAIAASNQNLKFKEELFFKDEDRDKVTILSPIGENVLDKYDNVVSHFMGIMGYACSLSSSKEFSQIKVVFTREWTPTTRKSLFSESTFLCKIDKSIEKLEIPKNISNKIIFKVLDKPEDLSTELQGVILKIKSVAERHGTYIYEKEIYKRFPVVTGQFNTKYNLNELTDSFLVRSNEHLERNNCIYIPPSFFKPKEIKPNTSKVVVTAYTSDRLRRLIEQIKDEEWALIKTLFDHGVTWMLIGYNDPNDLINFFPSDIVEKYSKNIILKKYMDLNDVFIDCLALLCHPLFLGGGSTARQAISFNVPVLCTKDTLSDVSNILPEENLFTSFSEQLNKLIKWLVHSKDKESFILRQHLLFKEKSDFSKHKSYLPEAVNFALKSFKARKNMV